MNAIHSYPWTKFPTECLWYLVPMGLLHLAAFIAGCLILAVLTRTTRHRGTFRQRARRFALFSALLLITGSLANGLWSCLIWGRLYYSTDYVFDFSPFWPITQNTIDSEFANMRGQLLGVSLLQLQLVWLAFAAATWTTAVLAYRRIVRRPPPSRHTPAASGRRFAI